MNHSKDYNIREELKTPLQGHISQQTAYIDELYKDIRSPNRNQRKRYWIESDDRLPRSRERLVTQTMDLSKDDLIWNIPTRYVYSWVECLYLDHDDHVDSYGFHKRTFTFIQVKNMKDLFSSVLDDDQKHIVNGLLDMYKEKR